jgi:chromosome segregation ATPase
MVSLEQVRALEDRVEKAVAYIAALRSENAELERRLSEGKAVADDISAAAERKVADAELRAKAAEARLAAAESEAGEAAAARDAALGRVREFEARVTDMAERVAAAETRAAEIGARADEYRKDQARIEEGIIHALEKLDSFEDLVLSRPVGGEPAVGVDPPASAADPEAERAEDTAGIAEDTAGIAVKMPPRGGAGGGSRPSPDAGVGELDIF